MEATTKKQLVPKLRFKEFSSFQGIEKIGDYIDLITGYSFKSDEITEDESGIRLMRGINITEGFIRHSKDIDRYYIGDTDRLTKFFLKEGDLVLGMDGSKVGKNVSLVSKENAGSLLVQRVARIRSNGSISLNYLYQNIYSINFHRYVDVVNTSSGIPHISSKQISDFKIYLPTLPEQEKIASFLGSVDKKIAMLQQKKKALELYKKGVMQQLFTSPLERGQRGVSALRFKDSNGNKYPDWETKKLGEVVCRNICYGVVQPGIEDSKGVKFIRGGDVFQGKISNTLRVISKEITDKYKRTYLKGGELIMSLVGYPGETAIVPNELKGANIARQVALIDLDNTMENVFVHFYLSSVGGKKNVLSKIIGSAQQVINIVDLKKIIIPNPCLEEQQKIANFLSAIDVKIEHCASQLKKTQEFKKGLLQQMFV